MLLLAQTGWGQQDDKQRAKEAGFDRHLVKPLDPDGLNHDLIATQRALPQKLGPLSLN